MSRLEEISAPWPGHVPTALPGGRRQGCGSGVRVLCTLTLCRTAQRLWAGGTLEIDVRVWEQPLPHKGKKNLRRHCGENYLTAVVIVRLIFWTIPVVIFMT